MLSIGFPRTPGRLIRRTPKLAERRAENGALSRRVALGAVLAAPLVFAVMAADLLGRSWVPEFTLNRRAQLALIRPVMFYTG
ncbi:MAG: hypothetical protein AB7G47_14950 [Mycolicibacterium sp.]|uniref:hypothetical protein n=1 Tax=Mycolicibacterium sp. TaxID=2320850 RepID=UPI003C67A26D